MRISKIKNRSNPIFRGSIFKGRSDESIIWHGIADGGVGVNTVVPF
jgi:hypothetical protein